MRIYLFFNEHLTFRVSVCWSLERFHRDFNPRTLTYFVHYFWASFHHAGWLPAKMLRFIAYNVVILLHICLFTRTILADHSRGRSTYAVKERHHVPRKWTRVGPAPAWHTIQIQIGLKQSRFDELERHLYEGTYMIFALVAAFRSF